MDRQAFLSSMPFLVRNPTAAWPPRRSNNSGMATRMETLLPLPQDSSYKFKLSLEPAVATAVEGSSNQQKLEKIQPAFFGRPADEGSFSSSRKSKKFDPSLADLQVAVESSVGNTIDCSDETSVLKGRVLFVGGNHGTNTNNNNNNNNDSATTTKSQTPTSELHPIQHLPDSWPLFLYFKVDKEGFFQLDAKQLLHVDMEVDPEGKLPPSLMLVFASCIFRIFPLPCPSTNKTTNDSDTSKREWKIEALESLRFLEKQLHQLSSNIASNTLGSPESSSFPSSTIEGGQKDGGYPTPGGQSHSHSHSTLTSTSTNSSTRQHKKFKAAGSSTADEQQQQNALKENHWIRKGKRRRDALMRSLAGTQSVETILDMPLSVVKPDQLLQERAAMPKVHVETQAIPGPPQTKPRASETMAMGPLLTGIAEDVCASYGTNAETKELLHVFTREIKERRSHQMDQLLDSFFPKAPVRQSSSARKNNRRGNRDEEKNAAVETKSPEEVIKSMQRLMKQHRDLVTERSSYLQLPTRG